MRPHELRIAGLRSYRAETTVNFSDLNLLAIIGATGSGKSSLLEAITYALYGTATWGGRNVKALIADGAISMSVSLSFEAGNQQWLITRKASRSAYPGSSQELRCLSDPEQPKVDGASEVKARVAELIGLDYDGFRSCVLLPQGRFDQLLKSTPADRVGILKGILGLESLDAMRARAQQLEQVVGDRFETILKARNQFLPNPRETHEAAETRLAELVPRREQLTKLEARVQALVAEADEHQRAAEKASGAADRLIELADKGLLDRLRAIEQLQVEFITARTAAANAAATAERDACTATEAVAEARRGGRNAAAIAGLRATITAASTERHAIDQARIDLSEKRALLAADQETLWADRERAERLARGLDQQIESAQQAEAKAKQAHDAATALVARIEAIVAARKQLACAEENLRDRQTEAKLANQESKKTFEQQQQADSALKSAEDALDDANRADAAARAAHGCQPGDSCPVCSQPLAVTFRAPEASANLVALKAAFTAAQQTERAALTALTQGEALENNLTEDVKDSTTARDVAQATWNELDTGSLPGHLDPTTVVADEATLSLVNGPVELAEQEHQAAREASKTASGAHQEVAADVKAMEKGLAQRDRDTIIEGKRVDRREDDLRNGLSLVPDWVEIHETADLNSLTECGERLEAALHEAETREQLATKAAEVAREQQKALTGIKERIQAEVERPAANERNALRALAGEADRHREQPLPATPAAIAELIAWGEQVVDAGDTTFSALKATAEEELKLAHTKRQEGVALLQSAGFEKSTELHDAVIDIAGAIRHATSERTRSAGQLEPVKRLDALCSQAEQLRGGLRELAHQLGDGKFVGFVVDQRQRALLALASGILDEVTGGQYGFTKEFEIVDRQTGTSRTPDTLSGGETFLASLALALGLVELAGRSGGRLQALFLDEGFGSLDPDALDQALTELERRAEGGRLIAVISHVPVIAERIEEVLQVTKTPQGSDVRLLTEEERATLLLDDATQQAASAA